MAVPAVPMPARGRVSLLHGPSAYSTVGLVGEDQSVPRLTRCITVDGGELTASLKVKRHAVAQKYAALTEAMYAQWRSELRDG